MRSRSVALNKVVEEAREYPKSNYTRDQVMFCQICKEALPFKKLSDGEYYFEAIMFLDELKETKNHYQNYLALCPNHGAMFLHANGSRDLMKDMLLELSGTELEVVLGDEDVTIQFTENHLVDLKALIDDCS